MSQGSSTNQEFYETFIFILSQLIQKSLLREEKKIPQKKENFKRKWENLKFSHLWFVSLMNLFILKHFGLRDIIYTNTQYIYDSVKKNLNHSGVYANRGMGIRIWIHFFNRRKKVNVGLSIRVVLKKI